MTMSKEITKDLDGKKSFEVELPVGEFNHKELHELLQSLGAKPSEVKPKKP